MKLKIFAVFALVAMLGSQTVLASRTPPPLTFTELPGVLDMFLPPPPPPPIPMPEWIPAAIEPWDTMPDYAADLFDFFEYFGYAEEVYVPMPTPTPPMLEPVPEPVPTPAPTPPPAAEHPRGLTDISGHWAEGAIVYAFDRGMVHVQPNMTVQPNQAVTRGEFAFMLDGWVNANVDILHMFGFTFEGSNLSVVGVPADHVFRSNIDSLAFFGLVGGDADFGPDVLVQRQEITRILLNMLVRLPYSNFDSNYFAQLNTSAVLRRFDDEEQIAGWARDSVAVMADRGFMGGAGGSFRPSANLTRAEAYATFQNIERHLRGN